MQAVNRPRRIIFQFDTGNPGFGFTDERVSTDRLDEVVKFYMAPIDEKPNMIDSVWYEWGDGNRAQWPSMLEHLHHKHFPRWREAGIDPVKVLAEETRKRGREVFFSYRINTSDWAYDPGVAELTPLRQQHAEWIHQGLPKIPTSYFWDFSVAEVREFKLAVLREVAEMYDHDGINLFFPRVSVMFKAGQQWLHRDELTDFMRKLRHSLLDVEKKRGRPFLLAVTVPENLIGCHFDGMDVETWAREGLVDIFILGNRSSNVDLAAFRRITHGTRIKLYPSWDEHHASDGYYNASIDIYRGVYANFWNLGADGVHTFNLCYPNPKHMKVLGLEMWPGLEDRWEVQKQIYREIGSPESLQYKDKTFFVQRRGGGHGNTVVADPENWETPREMYTMTNMLAPLPATLDNQGKVDTLLSLSVADDVNAASDKIGQITLRLALSDPAAEALPAGDRLPPVIVAPYGHVNNPPEYSYSNVPPAKGIERQVEVRINNVKLGNALVGGGWMFETVKGPAKAAEGWLLFDVDPRFLSRGDNLVGVRVTQRPPDARQEIAIERLELYVDYR